MVNNGDCLVDVALTLSDHFHGDELAQLDSVRLALVIATHFRVKCATFAGA